MSITRRTQAQWMALFDAHRQSGISAAKFCRANKLCPKYFSKRQQQLGYKRSSAFVPVEVVSDASGYSLIETAKLNGLEPYQYLRQMFTQLPQVQTTDQLKALLPWNIKM